MKTISVTELKKKFDNKENFQLIDVREHDEVEICSIEGSTHIPMGEIPSRSEEIKTDVPVIVHCRSGMRSANVISYLEMNLKLENLHNLDGGILEWGNVIDKSISQY